MINCIIEVVELKLSFDILLYIFNFGGRTKSTRRMDPAKEDNLPVSSEELVGRSSSWTLGCDNILLDKLKNFSQNLEQKSTDISKDCESLSKDVTILQAKLHNVTNQFLMLSNSQFIENRVQEFEESSVAVSSNAVQNSSASCSNKGKTKAEKEADLIAKMKEAIKIGVSANMEHLQNGCDRSNHESAKSKLSLPYLIGSPKYFSSRYVGLVNDEMRVASDIQSSNQYPDASRIPSLNESSYSLSSQTSNMGKFPQASTDTPRESESASHSVPDYVSKLHGDQLPVSEHSVILPPTLAHMGPPSAPSVTKRNAFLDRDVPPPPAVDTDEESDDDFKPIASRSGGRLFADDDEDIFNDSSIFSPKVNATPYFSTTDYIEKHIGNARFASPPAVEPNDKISTSSKGVSDIGDAPVSDKISDRNKYLVHENEIQQPKVVEVNTSSENIPESRSKPKIPPGAVSIFGTVPPAEIPRLKTQQNIQPKTVVEEPETQLPGSSTKYVNVSDRGSSVGTNEDHETTSHSSLTSKGMTSSQGSLSEPVPAISNTSRLTKPKGIFDDDSDEDFFASKKPQPRIISEKGSNANFKDNSNSSTSYPTANTFNDNRLPKKKFKSSIFDASDSDDDLFSSASSSSSRTKQSGIKTDFAFGKKGAPGIGNRYDGLFGDVDSDVDLFANKSSGTGKLSEANLHKRMSDANEQIKIKLVEEPPIPSTTLASVSTEESKKMEIDTGVIEPNQPESLPTSIDLRDRDGIGDSQPEPEKEQSSLDKTDILSVSNNCNEADVKAVTTMAPEGRDKAVNESGNKPVRSDTTMEKTSKISKLKEKLSSSDKEDLNNPKKQPQLSTKVSVKKLALGLNINPLAMMPGAKPVKQGSVEEKTDSPTSDSIDIVSDPCTPESPTKAITINSEDNEAPNLVSSSSKSVPDGPGPGQLLPNLVKCRAKILAKRRPPSKQLLKSYKLIKEPSVDSPDESSPTPEVNNDDDLKSPEAVSADIDIFLGSPEEIIRPIVHSTDPPELLSPSTEEEDILPAINSRASVSFAENLPDVRDKSKSPDSVIQPVNVQDDFLFQKVDDKNDSLFQPKLPADEEHGQNPKLKNQTTKASSLWEDSDSDDIFASAAKKLKDPGQKKQDVSSKTNNIDQSTNLSKAAKEIGKSMLSPIMNDLKGAPSSDSKAPAIGATNSGDPLSRENSVSPLESTERLDPNPPLPVKEPHNLSQDKSQKNLFSEDDQNSSDDLFKANPVISQNHSTDRHTNSVPSSFSRDKVSVSKKKDPKGLFDSDAEDSDDLFKASTTGSKKSNNSRESSVPKESEENLPKPEKSKQLMSKKKRNSVSKKAMFSDSSDDDLFTTKSKKSLVP